MTPTLFTSCNTLPPEGAVLPLGRPGGKITPTLFTACNTLPPEGAVLSLGRPGGKMFYQETPWRE